MASVLSHLTYAGHSAFFLTVGEWNSSAYTIAIDPWLSENPLCPAEMKSPSKIDLIVLTHGHSDHAGDAVVLAKKHRCKVVAIFELAELLAEEGISENQLTPMGKGGTVQIDSFSLSLTHAIHSNSFEGKNGRKYAGEPCGVVIKDNQKSLYHAGDTCLFSDMKLIQEFHHPDVAILPMGDHYTMGPKEAAIGASWIGAKVTLPAHFGTFPLLTGTPGAFVRECTQRNMRTFPMKPGESVSFMALLEG